MCPHTLHQAPQAGLLTLTDSLFLFSGCCEEEEGGGGGQWGTRKRRKSRRCRQDSVEDGGGGTREGGTARVAVGEVGISRKFRSGG